MTALEVRPVPYRDPVAQSLVAAALAELTERYGSEGDATPVEPREFEPPEGDFLVAFLDGAPVGCAAWRSHGDGGTAAELKRMYTAPPVRGRGVARALLAAIEESARRRGRKRLILETGYAQPEAIRLYETSGYEPCENFGYYRDYPGVRSFARTL
ncbi:GNAT family N-acetyltransferase [Rhizomonospora bruguierae]|uniref:GNAT family N-acetyltransferase n=1 Tax=Rhizomonospora bruguierae TaxID=1581705 RepID=UPI001BCE2165|nr:GNAT family N-acetyltransferase [Micromonospora sp. NBRC 107566]